MGNIVQNGVTGNTPEDGYSKKKGNQPTLFRSCVGLTTLEVFGTLPRRVDEEGKPGKLREKGDCGNDKR